MDRDPAASIRASQETRFAREPDALPIRRRTLLGGIAGAATFSTLESAKAAPLEQNSESSEFSAQLARTKHLSEGMITLDHVDQLATITPQPSQIYYVQSHRANWAATRSGPRGGGIFFWDPDSNATPDGGTVFAVPGIAVGRFRRSLSTPASVSATWWGAQYDGVTDDSAPMQAAITYLKSKGGGTLTIEGRALCGNLTIDFQNVTIQGSSRDDTLLVKRGTLGISIRSNRVSFRHLSIISQGTMKDSQITNGVLYNIGSESSVGHIYNYDIDVIGFSGSGIEIRNAVDCTFVSAFFQHCNIGLKISPGGVKKNDFSTTVNLISVYASACQTGIFADRLYRSRFNVIGEYNNIAVLINTGAIVLDSCYFERNKQFGAKIINAGVSDLDTYSNDPVSDSIDRSWTVGVIRASERGYRSDNKFDVTAKNFGITSAFGTDPITLSAYGSKHNTGLKYGYSTVALFRGDNLLKPENWSSYLSNEFQGWDFTKNGYKIFSRNRQPLYGMKQSVSLSKGKLYIVDIKYTTQSDDSKETISVGTLEVISGVPFSAPTDGATTISFSARTPQIGFEGYIHAFTLAEVVEDAAHVAQAQDKLSRPGDGRGLVLTDGIPTSVFGIGEWVRERDPARNGYAAYVQTGTSVDDWAGIPFGLKQAAAHPDSKAQDLQTLRDEYNALLSKLRTAGILSR